MRCSASHGGHVLRCSPMRTSSSSGSSLSMYSKRRSSASSHSALCAIAHLLVLLGGGALTAVVHAAVGGVFAQLLAKQLASSVEPRHHGAHGRVHDLRDLLVR